MTFKEAVKTCLSKSFTFSGRASRSEFHKFWLFIMLVALLIGILEAFLFGPIEVIPQQVVPADIGTQSNEETPHLIYKSGPLTDLFGFVALIPLTSCACRRLHDSGRSGWWLAAPWIPLFVVWLGSLFLPEQALLVLAILAAIILLPTFLFVFALFSSRSEQSFNRYGPPPHAIQVSQAHREVFR